MHLTWLAAHQFCFQIPGRLKSNGEPKEFHVMWDYHIGLVRMTALFKACEHAKVDPLPKFVLLTDRIDDSSKGLGCESGIERSRFQYYWGGSESSRSASLVTLYFQTDLLQVTGCHLRQQRL